MKALIKSGAAVFILFVLLLAGTAGCRRADTIKLGFVGGLTGHLSDLGTPGRNGDRKSVV